MPVSRLVRRRRSSLANALLPARAGVYGIHHHHSLNASTARPVTFAPNVTPITYVESTDDSLSPSSFSPDDPSSSSSLFGIGAGGNGGDPESPSSKIFPPSETPAPPPARKRCPPGKRRSMGYIPRPPNAFMLFRADFVRQKHVPGSIETNHGSLSKIIGNCWRALPLDEKKYWEREATKAKAAHKLAYPDYRFRPVHNKNKDKEALAAKKKAEKAQKAAVSAEDEARCEEVAQLLLEGKKGDELAEAVRMLDVRREADASLSQSASSRATSVGLDAFGHGGFGFGGGGDVVHQPQPLHHSYHQHHYGGLVQHRRSSSVPLPGHMGLGMGMGGIALPSLPFLATTNANAAFDASSNTSYSSRAPSPVSSISRLAYSNHNNSNNNTQYQQQNQQGFTFAPPPAQASYYAHQQPQPQHFHPFPQQPQHFAPLAQQQHAHYGYTQRRASSVGLPDVPNPWFSFPPSSHPSSTHSTSSSGGGGNGALFLQRDDSPLPEADTSLFEASFLSSSVFSTNSHSASSNCGETPGCPGLDLSGSLSSSASGSASASSVSSAAPTRGAFDLFDFQSGIVGAGAGLGGRGDASGDEGIAPHEMGPGGGGSGSGSGEGFEGGMEMGGMEMWYRQQQQQQQAAAQQQHQQTQEEMPSVVMMPSSLSSGLGSYTIAEGTDMGDMGEMGDMMWAVGVEDMGLGDGSLGFQLVDASSSIAAKQQQQQQQQQEYAQQHEQLEQEQYNEVQGGYEVYQGHGEEMYGGGGFVDQVLV